MLKKHSLLILEDDPVQQALLERMLTGYPYALTLATTAEEALDAFGKLRHDIVICDINLPDGMSGVQVLKQFMEADRPPVVIMLTGDADIKMVIETMRLGAYDYIVKPAQAEELRRIVENAADHVHTNETTRTMEKERIRRLQKQMASRHVAEQLMRRQNDKFAKALFGNIHTSFAQGKGIGTLTTLISMLAGAPKTPDGKNYLVEIDILEMIFENQGAVTAMIDMFSELQMLVSQDFVLYDVTLGEFHNIIRDTVYELQPMSAMQKHRIILSELPMRFAGSKLKLNWEFMRKALRELLLNAMKFATPDSSITVLVEYIYTRLLVTVINVPKAPTSDEPYGIPEEYRKVIFEPFFRISRLVHEQYQTLEYGLGLTFVEKIIQMHHGSIRCTTIGDYATESNAGSELTAFEIELPT